ncbi:F-box protein CPR30-like [Gossypium australe]|uniref:F-box protein CPR30-like n=1 Tax=Gossypium australe TaxID=47621 RepID=A0A5B6WKX8_9ROSI|nr:F-box protein CPR30-like [Gossypium australe]
MQRPRFELPEALVMKILSKLPVKSLTRFNCNTSSVYGACHGLLCLHDPLEDKAAIWNPSTREFKILPPSSIQRPPYFSPFEETYLSLDDVSFNNAAFGFDSKTDDYKVIRFVSLTFVNSEEEYSHPHFLHQVELSDSWKEIPSPDYTPTEPNGNIFVDGICYWKTVYGGYLDFRGLILSFDLGNEEFSILPIPEFVGSLPEYYVDLLVFNGSLGVIVYPSERIDTSFDLWVTSEGVWTKQFNFKSISGVVRLLGFGKNGDLFLRDTNDEVLLFDASTQELKELEINTYLDHFRFAISLHAYVESLVRINGIQKLKKHIIRQPARDA